MNWVAAVYREPGNHRIHALVDMEYHDEDPAHSPPCNAQDSTSNPCWYNAITYAYSDDYGATFIQPPPGSAQHFVAALPYQWDYQLGPRRCLSNGTCYITSKPHGYFAPAANILKLPDGYYYIFVPVIYDPVHSATSRRICLMRTTNLGDASSWRFWNGAAFNFVARNPYANGVSYNETIAHPDQYICAEVDPNIQDFPGSVTYNTYLHKYMMIETIGNCGSIPGFYYALSNDLIHWSRPVILRPGNLPHCDPGESFVYPSLVDHSDTSVNFENTDNRFYLYYLDYIGGLERNLLREPVTIS